jgi:hypothetical protein
MKSRKTRMMMMRTTRRMRKRKKKRRRRVRTLVVKMRPPTRKSQRMQGTRPRRRPEMTLDPRINRVAIN